MWKYSIIITVPKYVRAAIFLKISIGNIELFCVLFKHLKFFFVNQNYELQ